MRSFLASVAAALLLTGCGAAIAPLAARHPGTRPRTVSAVDGSRTVAQAYVRYLMAELSLPAGSQPAHLRSLPQIVRAQAPGAPGWAGASRIMIVPGQPLAVLQRISAHAPFNDPVLFSATPVMSGTIRQAPVPGIDVVILDLAVTAHSRTTTLVGAYAFAAWLPHRTAAEHLDAASFRAVTVTRNQVFARPRTVSRTFTSSAVIARLTSFLDGRSPAPRSLTDEMSCAPGAGYTLRFTARDEHGPAVTVSALCQTAAVTVNGKPQPLLWDTGGRLGTIASQLLGR